MALEPSDSQDQPWGAFPAERYLIQNWSDAPGEDKMEQYRRLIRAFRDSGELVNETDSVYAGAVEPQASPSEHQVDSILKPWRSEKLRRIAGGLKREQDDLIVILRTHYSGNAADDDLLQKVLQEDEDMDPNAEPAKNWWRVLDDGALFDFGDDWEKVLNILPELTRRGKGEKSLITREKLKEAATSDEQYGIGAHEYVQSKAILGAVPIALMDKEAFSTSLLNLIFLDANGNTVRSARVETEVLGEYRMSAFQGSVQDMSAWEDSKVGDKYQADGSIGRVLYRRIGEAETP